MSSAYGIARTYNQFIPPVNLELMAQAMSNMQQRYDQGYAEISAYSDMLNNTDIVKSEDREYFKQKLDRLIQDVNNLQGTNLGSKSSVKAIKNHLAQTLDPNVINAIISTKKYRAFQESVAKVKDKHPDKYSVVNEMYAMRPFMEYMNDGQVGSKLEDMRYSDKVDVQKNKADLLKDLMTNRKNEVFEVQARDRNNNPIPGKMIKRTFSGLKPEEVDAVIDGLMSSEDKQQLAIDGWYKFGLANVEDSDNKLREYQKLTNNNLEAEIALIEKGKEGKTKEEIAEADERIANYKNLQARVNAEINSSYGSVENAGYFFEKTTLKENLKTMYKYHQIGEEIKVDEHYKMMVDHDFKQQEINLNREKFEWEKIKDTLAANALGNPNNPDNGVSVFSEGTKLEDIDIDKGLKAVETEEKAIEADLEKMVTDLFGAKAANILKSLDEDRTGRDKTILLFEKLEGLNVSKVAIADLRKRYDVVKNFREDAAKKYNESADSFISKITKSEEGKKSVVENAWADNHKITLYVGGKPKQYGFREYLKMRGYKDGEDINKFVEANPTVRDHIARQALVDNLFDGSVGISGASRLSFMGLTSDKNYNPHKIRDGGHIWSESDEGSHFNKESIFYLKQIAKTYGENFEEIVYKNGKAVLKGAPKASLFLQHNATRMTYSFGLPFVTDNFGQSETTKKALNYEGFAEEYKDRMKESFGKFNINQTVTIAPKSAIHQGLMNISSQEAKNQNIYIRKDETGYILTTDKTTKVGDKYVIEKIQLNQKPYTEEKLRQVKGIENVLDFNQNTGIIAKNVYTPIKDLRLTYYNDRDVVNMPSSSRIMYQKAGSEAIVSNLADNKELQGYYNYLSEVVSNPSKVKVSTQKIEASAGYPSSVMINYTYDGAKLFNYAVSESDYNNEKRDALYYENPVVFNQLLSLAVENIITSKGKGASTLHLNQN